MQGQNEKKINLHPLYHLSYLFPTSHVKNFKPVISSLVFQLECKTCIALKVQVKCNALNENENVKKTFFNEARNHICNKTCLNQFQDCFKLLRLVITCYLYFTKKHVNFFTTNIVFRWQTVFHPPPLLRFLKYGWHRMAYFLAYYNLHWTNDTINLISLMFKWSLNGCTTDFRACGSGTQNPAPTFFTCKFVGAGTCL